VKRFNTILFSLMIVCSLLAACAPPVAPIAPTTTPFPPPTSTPAPTVTPDVPKNTATPNASVILSKAPALIPAKDRPVREGKHFDMEAKGDAVVYTLPEMDSVLLASDLSYFKTVKVDIYYPPNYKFEKKLPVVIETHGTTETFAFDNDNPIEISQAKLIAASGMIVVAAQASRDPLLNFYHLLDFLAVNADRLGIDINNIGFWETLDTGGPMLMALQNKGLAFRGNFKAAVMLTPSVTLLANPADLPPGFSLFVVNANIGDGNRQEIDTFVEQARASNLPVEYIQLGESPFFYIDDNSQTSKDTLQKALEFLKSRLFQK
jgi:hypothetical protein